MRTLSLLIALAAFSPATLAQFGASGGAGATPSSSPVTPELVGMGFAGVAMPSDGAGSFLLNPARVASVEPGVSVSLLGRRFELDSGGFADSDNYLNAYSLTAGFPLSDTKWRAGLGLGRSLFVLEQVETDQFGDVIDSFSITFSALVLSAAMAYEGPVEVSVGVAARRVSDPFLLTDADDLELENVSGWGVDLGAQARYAFLKPGLDGGLTGSVGVGYALQNWGSALSIPVTSFFNTEEGTLTDVPYPLAARARLGWTGSLGYDVYRGSRRVQAVGLDIALEASHSLTRQVDPTEPGEFPTYRAAVPLGRIRPLDALLGRNRDADLEQRGDITFSRAASVVGHRAIRLHVLETLTLRYGVHGSNAFSSADGSANHAFGLGLSAAGLFRLVDADGTPGTFADRGDLQVSYARYALYDNDEPDTIAQAQPWVLGLTLVARWP